MHLSEVALPAEGEKIISLVTTTETVAETLDSDNEESIPYDVCIIGGGATGTYAAVRLLEDCKKRVLVVERSTKLGGNVHTFYCPGSEAPVDFGVQAYNNVPTTLAFFERFNVALEPVGTPSLAMHNVDLRTGEFVEPVRGNPVVALMRYAQLVQKYQYLVHGYGDIPDDFPKELSDPFGKFIEDNQLHDAVPIIWTFAFGVGNLLEATTLSVMQNFGHLQICDLFTMGFRTTSNHNNSELYEKAAALLGKTVLYQSTVVRRNFDEEGLHVLTIATPDGNKTIRSRKVLITIPPTLANLQPFALDAGEEKVFSQWKWLNCYVAVVSDTGLGDGIQIINADTKAPFNLPKLPFVWHYDYSGTPGRYIVKVVGDDNFSADDAKRLILDDLARIGNDETVLRGKVANIDAFASHCPLQLHPDVGALKSGFYKKLYALQGHRDTYYTGHAWTGDYSSQLWEFTERVIVSMFP